MLTWREDSLPSVGETRTAFASLLGAKDAVPARAAPLATASSGTPAAGLAEVLAAGDRAAQEAAVDDAHEPVPSAFFDDAVEHAPR